MRKKYIIFYIVFLIIIIYFCIKILFNIKIFNKNNFNSKKEISICLCTFGKEENKYIKEFIDYYIKYGVDKIFIYDNNDINGETFDIILSDFIKNNTVKIINCRGQSNIQREKMNHCYLNNFKKYNWLIFYDVDEFIYLKNYSKIKDFLNEKKFKKCQMISLTSVFHTDNNHLYYENKPVLERFPDINKNITIL